MGIHKPNFNKTRAHNACRIIKFLRKTRVNVIPRSPIQTYVGYVKEKAIHFTSSLTDFGTIDPWSPNYMERDAPRRYRPSNFVALWSTVFIFVVTKHIIVNLFKYYLIKMLLIILQLKLYYCQKFNSKKIVSSGCNTSDVTEHCWSHLFYWAII